MFVPVVDNCNRYLLFSNQMQIKFTLLYMFKKPYLSVGMYASNYDDDTQPRRAAGGNVVLYLHLKLRPRVETTLQSINRLL